MEAFHLIGSGKNESVYQRAVAIQLSRRGISHQEQVSVPIVCEGIAVGSDVLDFLIAKSLVLELKVANRFRRQDYAQVQRYLSAKQLPLGILVRFSADGVFSNRILRSSTPS